LAEIKTDGGSSPFGTTVRSSLETLGLVVAPFTVLVGLLYYFGWVRTAAIFNYFGFEQRLLAYSSDDYVLRSAGVAFRPLVIALLISACVLITFLALPKILERYPPRGQRAVVYAVAVIGLILIGLSVPVILGVVVTSAVMASAIALIIGTLLLEAAITLRSRGGRQAAGPESTSPPSSTGPRSRATIMRRVVVGGTVLLGAFWACALYANDAGTRVAAAWADNPNLRPGVIIYSEDDLQLDGPGVTVNAFPPGALYAFKYEGLRLLIYSNERWFLYPVGWRRDGRTSAVLLKDSDSIRIEVLPAG
jgi:hypothetical protein